MLRLIHTAMFRIWQMALMRPRPALFRSGRLEIVMRCFLVGVWLNLNRVALAGLIDSNFDNADEIKAYLSPFTTRFGRAETLFPSYWMLMA